MGTWTGNPVVEIGAGTGSSIPGLTQLAANGLEGMFDGKKRLFSFRAIRTEQGIMNDGVSIRYTIISLLGLHQFEAYGNKSPIDIRKALNALVDDAKGIDDIGDLGLLIWLCAVASPHLLSRIWSASRIRETYPRNRSVLQGRTMELAWFLSGLAHVKLLPQQPSVQGLEELAERTCRLLFRNNDGMGIFRHMGNSSPAGIIRGRIGSFADQVYPIHALSLYARAFGSQRALDLALGCANTMCNLQGSRGQWWWLYDSVSGRVVKHYPVYSVHQDGMAPMALFVVGEAAGKDFRESIFKGLRWIQGNNELGMSLIDPSRNVIWRCFERDSYKSYLSDLWSFVNDSGNREQEYGDLRIKYECRSYHLGWLLYAFSDPRLA